MSDHIKTAIGRVDWARKHINEFDAEIKAFIGSGEHQVIREAQPEGEGWIRYSYRFITKAEIADHMKYIFGDAVHNLRSVCDNLVSGLGETLGIPAKDKLYFPCQIDPGTPDKGFAKWRVDNSKKFPVAFLDAVEALQPFNAHVTAKGRTMVGTEHPLYILTELWNYDKHKMPLEPIGFHAGTGVHFPMGVDGAMFFAKGMTMLVGNTMHDGAVLLSFAVPESYDPANIKIPITLGVAMQKDGPVAPGKNAHLLLVEMHDFVRNEVIPRIEPFF